MIRMPLRRVMDVVRLCRREKTYVLMSLWECSETVDMRGLLSGRSFN